MKIYKLKRDLPTFKAGDKFHISSNGNLVHTESGAVAYMRGILKKNPNILKDWFEEIPEELKVELSGQYVPENNSSFNVTFSRVFGAEPDISPSGYAEVMAELGMSFKTKAECQKWIEKMKAYQILRQDAKGFEPDWSDHSQLKHIGYYDHEARVLRSEEWQYLQYFGTICFRTGDDIEESFRTHRKEWLTVLGVEG